MENEAKKYVLVDDHSVRDNLLPLTYCRPVAGLRVGITTIREKWERELGKPCACKTVDYLFEKYPYEIDAGTECRPSNVVPGVGEINHLYDIFLLNAKAIEADFASITAGRRSMPLSDTCTVIGDASRIFIEEGAVVEGAMLNTRGGCIYIGKDAEVMEGACLRGPIAICEHAVVNMGAKIYGGTTIGPWCKVGGELNNVVMQAYSNKAHDGFLGNAVIGEWCNLGAGCVASNLKNDYTEIKLWNYPAQRFLKTGLQFCGVIMGDHTKCGINSMLNTATVLGVGVNIHGTGFPRPFVASFCETSGGASGYTEVSMTKFFDIASRMMARRHIELTEADKRMFYAIREIASAYRL
ncbi:MAG: glucose-1-phosphate thymidylyltransferase [Muribaculaceae bacterium]|nr:glucose-1-phosphate thymidylyltransferase [Muribaculaceae bacterium]